MTATTVAQLRNFLHMFPDNWPIELYSDDNVDGIAVLNPTGKATTTDTVIEIPQP